MTDDITEIEPWTYTVDGADIDGRKVWHVESPGPTGCGIVFHEIDAHDILGDDNVWERHIYAWAPHTNPCTVPDCLGWNEATNGR